jgi:sestrin
MTSSLRRKHPVSLFAPGDPTPLTEDAEVADVARLSGAHRIMACHPAYLLLFHDMSSALMNRDDLGALSLDWRCYIAIMAAARHRCATLVRRLSRDFKEHGGDARWLEPGVDGAPNPHVPRKLAALSEINAILCHQPWRLTVEHIQHLLNPPSSSGDGGGESTTQGSDDCESADVKGDGAAAGGGQSSAGAREAAHVGAACVVDIRQLRRERHAASSDESSSSSSSSSSTSQRGRRRPTAAHTEGSSLVQLEATCGGDDTAAPGQGTVAGAADETGRDEGGEGAQEQQEEDVSWSVNELVCAIMVMATHHALAGFELGMGTVETHGTAPEEEFEEESVFLGTGEGEVVAAATADAEGTAATEDDTAAGADGIAGIAEGSRVEQQHGFGSSEAAGGTAWLSRRLQGEDWMGDAFDDENEDESGGFNHAGVMDDDQEEYLADAEEPAAVQAARVSLAVAADAQSVEPEVAAASAAAGADAAGSQEKEHSSGSGGSLAFSRRHLSHANALCLSLNQRSALVYKNFDVRSDEYRTYRTSEFDWKEHGFALANRFFPGATPLIDELFEHTFEFTYNTLGGIGDHDTSPFRNSIWYYTLRLYGVHYDDYNYGEINSVCRKPTKVYVKIVACNPIKMTAEHFATMAKSEGFQFSEMVHINFLVMEARKQAILLYALRCIMAVIRPRD